MLILDLGVFHKKAHVITVKESLIWTFTWVILALLFNGFVYYFLGKEKALEFFTGYLIEKSLSIDNIFVIALIFKYFGVEQQSQHKVLFWGILGALIFRAIFIIAGITLLEEFHYTIYIFGLILIITGIRLFFKHDKTIDPGSNPVIKLAKKVLPITAHYEPNRFLVIQNGKRYFTPLFLVLIMIETTDLLFAIDSIPAILAISKHSFIVYSSNAFAILGMRSLYFTLSHLVEKFKNLNYGLAAILVFVGVKMLISDFFKIPTGIALIVIVIIILISILSSLPLKGNSKKNR